MLEIHREIVVFGFVTGWPNNGAPPIKKDRVQQFDVLNFMTIAIVQIDLMCL